MIKFVKFDCYSNDFWFSSLMYQLSIKQSIIKLIEISIIHKTIYSFLRKILLSWSEDIFFVELKCIDPNNLFFAYCYDLCLTLCNIITIFSKQECSFSLCNCCFQGRFERYWFFVVPHYLKFFATALFGFINSCVLSSSALFAFITRG